jgi:hypothetical protein
MEIAEVGLPRQFEPLRNVSVSDDAEVRKLKKTLAKSKGVVESNHGGIRFF